MYGKSDPFVQTVDVHNMEFISNYDKGGSILNMYRKNHGFNFCQ